MVKAIYYTTSRSKYPQPLLLAVESFCKEWKRCPLQVVAGPFAPRPSPHVEPGFGLPGHRNLQAQKPFSFTHGQKLVNGILIHLEVPVACF